jgi:hydrogenase expression/formation protein HypC
MCVGIPGQVVAVDDPETAMATVEFGGIRRAVNVACVLDRPEAPPAALVGAWVLVHAGFAMSRIDAREAAETLRLLAELGEHEAEMAALSTHGEDSA